MKHTPQERVGPGAHFLGYLFSFFLLVQNSWIFPKYSLELKIQKNLEVPNAYDKRSNF